LAVHWAYEPSNFEGSFGCFLWPWVKLIISTWAVSSREINTYTKRLDAQCDM